MKLHANPSKNQVDPSAYCVSVNGERLDLFKTVREMKNEESDFFYAFGSFDLEEEEEVLIEVTSERDLSNALILPEKNSLHLLERAAHKLLLRGREPFMISIEPDGRNNTPLLLFGREAEKNIPCKEDPDVIWFGPGEHKADKIVLKENQTLYLESGSLVHGAIHASGNNIRICGRGVLSQELYERGWVFACTEFFHCNDLVIEGFIIKDPCYWDLVLRDCRRVKIDSIAVCGGRMINDDAIDICNSSDILITNSFVRSMDDVIAIKGEPDLPLIPNNKIGHEAFTSEMSADPFHCRKERAVENVEIHSCVFWCDGANVFRIGFECTAPCFLNFDFHDIEVIHCSPRYEPCSEFWSHYVFMIQPSCTMPMEDMRFERINIHSDGIRAMLLAIRCEPCNKWLQSGSARNFLFKDIAVSGPRGEFEGEIFLRCHDEKSFIRNITLQNVTYFGEKLTAENALIYQEEGNVNVEELRFE